MTAVFGIDSCDGSECTSWGWIGVSTASGPDKLAELTVIGGPLSDAEPLVICSCESVKTDGVTTRDCDAICTACVVA